MRLSPYETSALRDLAAVTTKRHASKVRAALREAVSDDDVATALALRLAPGHPSAVGVLEAMPSELRAGSRGVLRDGRCTYLWLAFGWLAHHGLEWDITALRLVSGGTAQFCNVEWEKPT